MRLAETTARAFLASVREESIKLGMALGVPSVNQVEGLIDQSLLGVLLSKEAATRAVKEWRKADAAGDQAGATQIAQSSAQAGLKPRYLNDISIGGMEAGVDRMMGHAGVQNTGQQQVRGASPQAAAPSQVQGRLEAYKQNKNQLGLQGRTPAQDVLQSPQGRGALLRPTLPQGPQGPGAAPNESGVMARKLYKPDSAISRAEFTPKLLEQKQRLTDQARGLSPEAKNMVPAMYGHQTMNAQNPSLQRTTSMHEYVPGLEDIRGKNTGTEDKKIFNRPQAARGKDLTDIQSNVLAPLRAKGNDLTDVIHPENGPNFGNVMASPQGPKVLDFLPQIKGERAPHMDSFRKYAPELNEGQFSEKGGKNLQDLRKEVFKPQMQINEAKPMAQAAAGSLVGQPSQPLKQNTPAVAEARTPIPAARQGTPPAATPAPVRPTPQADPFPAARPAASPPPLPARATAPAPAATGLARPTPPPLPAMRGPVAPPLKPNLLGRAVTPFKGAFR